MVFESDWMMNSFSRTGDQTDESHSTLGRFGGYTEAHLAASFGAEVGQTDAVCAIRFVRSVSLTEASSLDPLR